MFVAQSAVSQGVLQRVLWIQTLTLVWMGVEAVSSLGAAWMARSPALLAFGGAIARSNFSPGRLCFGGFTHPLMGRTRSRELGKLQAACCLSWRSLLRLLMF